MLEPVVAVFDTRTMALRADAQLRAADYDDIWLGIVRGESDAGETLVGADDGATESTLYSVLTQRETLAEHARRFDGILPPGTAVMSLRAAAKRDSAVAIIELAGGHIEH